MCTFKKEDIERELFCTVSNTSRLILSQYSKKDLLILYNGRLIFISISTPNVGMKDPKVFCYILLLYVLKQ